MSMSVRSRWISAAAVLLLGVGAGAVVVLSRPGPRLNVILVSIDTMRPDRTGMYGHKPLGLSTTPFLDSLAQEGALFLDAVSTTSWTLPAHHALFTGAPDQVHKMVNDRFAPRPALPALAELLQQAGYATAGFTSGPYLNPLFGFKRGFDTYVEQRGLMGATIDPADLKNPERLKRAREVFHAQEAVTSDRITDRGVEFVRQNADRPFFLFLHYFDPHNDYLPPPPFDTRFGAPYSGWVDGRGVTQDERYGAGMAAADLERLKALYDGEIGWVDQNIGRFFQRIRSIDPAILERTLVVVVSDHGEEFLEHGHLCHQKNLYQSSVSVALLLVCPGRIPAGSRVESLVRIYDVFPTVTELAGIDVPAGVAGRSLLPLVTGEETEPRPALLDLLNIAGERSLTRHTGLRLGNLKFIAVEEREWSMEDPSNFRGRVLSERCELFDLGSDPGEQNDLAPSRPDLVQRLKKATGELLAALETQSRPDGAAGAAGPAGSELPEDLKRSLEELGYGGGR